MRRATSLLIVAGSLVLPAAAWSRGRPEPITCPSDVVAGMAEMCPCDGKLMPDDSTQRWRNHGQYVSCVARYRNQLRKAGCFTDDSVRRTLVRCAARSTCGKATAVLCCTYESGMCSDPTPGNMVAEGTCSNDSALVCDSDTDCTKSSARLARDADTCAADGGSAVGGGSVCSECPPLMP